MGYAISVIDYIVSVIDYIVLLIDYIVWDMDYIIWFGKILFHITIYSEQFSEI
jgi:hypothetical protein